MSDKCSYCGQYVSFPCTTLCEQMHCTGPLIPGAHNSELEQTPRVITKKEDTINHPPHYARWKMEPIEFIATNDLPWWLANVIKYCMRYDAKDGLKDLHKARTYLDMKIASLEGRDRFWANPKPAAYS